jgi:hypothetical protein
MVPPMITSPVATTISGMVPVTVSVTPRPSSKRPTEITHTMVPSVWVVVRRTPKGAVHVLVSIVVAVATVASSASGSNKAGSTLEGSSTAHRPVPSAAQPSGHGVARTVPSG